ncbi:Oidioi.mRNA.OKI2018_I69.chr1.g1133.t1.cds [Oikopleura dioica]|uniref:Microtubule-associated protein n=1 Tax=Oikopleura dioica TaxID=34765 RepID=A0ABN7SU30_OIKDI|nr:Oidioi.mRNA.OKI2018_I69.chr1.g1133.t1.cds [Oikopleura dioica]
MQGPPVNRASALRAYAVRQRMDYGSSYAEDAYLPKRFRRSRAMNYSRLSNSIDSSGYGTNQFSGRSSPDRWSRGSRMSNSRFSAVHPLSIRSHEEIFQMGPTKWTDQPIQSKIGSLDNFDHVPGGGDKDINEIKYRFNAPNSISSRTKVIYGPRRDRMSKDEESGLEIMEENLFDKPHEKGNDFETIKVDNEEFEQLPNWRFRPKQTRSKCGTLDNVNHRPGGGTNRIFTERMPWQEGYKYGR